MNTAPCLACQGKQTYFTRAEARRVAKRRFPGMRMNAYECPIGTGWHFGHLPTAVRAGRLARSEIRDKE